MAIYKSNIGGSLLDGLVAYYPLNGNANDESGNGNDAISAGVAYSSNRFMHNLSAARFFGDDSINLPDNIKPTSNCSISVWVLFLPDSGFIPVYGGLGAVGVVNGYGITLYKTQIEIYTSTERIYYLLNFSFKNYVWYNITFCYNGNEGFIYINGDRLNTNSFISSTRGDLGDIIGNITIDWTQPGDKFYIGRSGSNYLNGIVDDFRLYNRSLSEVEVNDIYKETFTTISLPKLGTDKKFPSLINIDNFLDIIPYAKDTNFTVNNEILEFDGSKYLKLPNVKVNNYFSVRVIFKIITTGVQQYVFTSSPDDTLTTGVSIRVNSSDQIEVVSGSILYTSGTLDQDRWYDVIFASDNTNGYVFIDGKIRASSIDTSTLDLLNFESYVLGSSYTGSTFLTGEIKNITIWDGVVSEYIAYILYSGKYKDIGLLDNLIDGYQLGNVNNQSFKDSELTVFGTVVSDTDKFGNSGKAYYFAESASNYVESTSYNLSKPIQSFSFWMKAELQDAAAAGLLHFNRNLDPRLNLFLTRNTGVMNLQFRKNSSNSLTLATFISSNFYTNEWMHVYIELDPDNSVIADRIIFYVNGEKYNNNQVISNTGNIQGTRINNGILELGGSTVNSYKGWLSSVKLFDRKLNEFEIKYLATTRDYQYTGLILETAFDNNVLDISGNSNDGTSFATNYQSIDRTGTKNCLILGASRVQFPINFEIYDEITISLWVKVYQHDPNNTPISTSDESDQIEFFYRLSAFDGYLTFTNNPTAGSPDFNHGTYQWHLVTIRINSSSYKVNFDGLTHSSEQVKTNDYYKTNQRLVLGSRYYDSQFRYFFGFVSDLKVYDRYISDQEVDVIYKENNWPPDTTEKIDQVFSNINNYYTQNTPTRNETFDYTNFGNSPLYPSPTGGMSNPDIVNIQSLFTSAGFTATIIINT